VKEVNAKMGSHAGGEIDARYGADEKSADAARAGPADGQAGTEVTEMK
jgi:hypothetical protein